MSKSLLSILNGKEKKICEDIIDGKAEIHSQDQLYNKIYDHYCSTGEMPYDVQKARGQDPMSWICNKIEKEFSKLQ